MNIKSFYLCIDMGDLIYSLLFCKVLGVNTIYLDGKCGTVKFNEESAKFLLPIVKQQPYIKTAELYTNQPYDNNYGLHPLDTKVIMHTDLLQYHASKFVIDPTIDINNVTWLSSNTINDPNISNKKILINRTFRYHGDKYFYYKMLSSFNLKHFVFAGLEEEYHYFCREFNVSIDYIKTDNSIDLLSLVNSVPIFLGNESLICAMAIGLGKTCYIEYGRFAANYIFNRQNIFYF